MHFDDVGTQLKKTIIDSSNQEHQEGIAKFLV